MLKNCQRGLRASTALAVSVIAAVFAQSAAAINVQIVNNSGVAPENVYLLLDNGSSTDGQLPANTSVQLSNVVNSSFSLGNIASGRLFFSFNNAVPANVGMDSPIRNDKIEFTNPGKANLTSVDYFGIPIDMETLDSGNNVLETLAFRCHTATVNPQLTAVQSAAGGATIDDGAGGIARILAPQIIASSYPAMDGYLQSMAGQTITVNSAFFGTPYTTTNYSGTFAADGSITLTGTLAYPNGGAPTPTPTPLPVTISGTSMQAGVYTGNSPYTKGSAAGAVGDNDVYAVIYRDVVAGFGLGYWGAKYGNSSTAWTGQPAFASAWNSPPAFSPYFNQYANVIYQNSDAYGFSFNDVGPTPVQATLNSSVATMRVTIDSDQGPNTPGCVGNSTPAAAPPAVPVTPPTPASPRASLDIRTGASRLMAHGRAPIALKCTGDPCKGELVLTARRRIDRRWRSFEVGRANFAVPENGSRRLLVKLTRAGLTAMNRARGRRLSVLATARLGPRNKAALADRRRVELLPYVPRRR